jgi:hypothetical protein
MKRTRERRQERQQLGGRARGLKEAELASVVGGDLYLHNPRGSNDGPSGSGG